MAPPSKFTIEEENFAIKCFIKGLGPTATKRAMRKEFKQSRKLFKTQASNLKRIYKRFQTYGIQKHHQASDMPKRSADPVVAEKVVSFIEEAPTSSLRSAVRELNVPKTTVF